MATGRAYRSVFRPGLFDDQVVLVTGGGTGIGRCTAHELAALGATVVLAARREEPLTTTAAEIAEAGGPVADVVTLDIRDPELVDEVLADVVARHGRLDGLVNNAGGQFPAPAAEMRPKGWRTVVDLNLHGTFWVTQAAYRHALAEHGGAVVSVVADVGNGFPFFAHTAAARAGVINLTKTLAVEWAASRVRLNAVAPGLVYSSGMETYDADVQRLAAATGRRIPAGRIGTESEVAAAICFLLSDAAAFITGVTLPVDGGAPLARVPTVELGEHEPVAAFDGFHLAREVPGFWRGERGEKEPGED